MLVDSASRDAILSTLEQMGWPRNEVDRVIQNESGWNTAARNPIGGAVGLIQFMPATLVGLGYNAGPDSFQQLSALEQLPWIQKYFSGGRRWKIPGDTYLRTFWPDAVGEPDNFQIARPDSVGFELKVWQQNPGLRESPTGPITAGSVRKLALGGPVHHPLPHNPPPDSDSSGS